MDKKHGELIANLQTLLQGVFADQNKTGTNPTFAGIVTRGTGGVAGGSGGDPPARHGHDRNLPRSRGRSVSPSVKRLRAEDGSSVVTMN